MLEHVSSMQNLTIQKMRQLKSRKAREEQGLILVEGAKMIMEALDAGIVVREALVEDEKIEVFQAVAERLVRKGAKVLTVPRRIIEAVSDTTTPSGVCATFVPPDWLDVEGLPSWLVAIDGVQDPGNVGTIWRTADAAGFGGLIAGPGTADLRSPKVLRGTMGSMFRVGAMESEHLAGTLEALRGKGYKVVITSLEGADIYQRAEIGDKFVVVIGSEARGVGEDVVACADVKVKLPMRGGAESLNAAVAAGIVMYELTRGK